MRIMPIFAEFLFACSSEYTLSPSNTGASSNSNTGSEEELPASLPDLNADSLMELCQGVTRESCPTHDVSSSETVACQEAADQIDVLTAEQLTDWATDSLTVWDILDGKLDLAAYTQYAEGMIGYGEDGSETVFYSYDLYIYPGMYYADLDEELAGQGYVYPPHFGVFPYIACTADSIDYPPDEDGTISSYRYHFVTVELGGAEFIKREIGSNWVRSKDMGLFWEAQINGSEHILNETYPDPEEQPTDHALLTDDTNDLFDIQAEAVTGFFGQDPAERTPIVQSILYFEQAI